MIEGLFKLNSLEMLKLLEKVEEEMLEDSYSDEAYAIETIAKNAKEYIKAVFDFMKIHYKEESCNVLHMITELYRIAASGEYTYLQDITDIGYKNAVFEKMKGESGYREVLYAVRLLRYFYLVREKKNNPYRVWRDIEKIYKKVQELGPLTKKEKKERENHTEKELTEEAFIPAFRNHMDKYMIGQDVLKKKLCTVIYQYKYHGVRSTLLMMGPSGSGKNHMISTIKSFPELGFPVVSYDCSSLTPNGFTGADVRDIFKKVNAEKRSNAMKNNLNYNSGDCRCIVFLDEVDKIINYNHDSHGESVNAMIQQQLLSSLAGTEVIEGIDTSKVLFILGGAFPRIDDLKKEKKAIGFNSGAECKMDIKESIRDQIIAIGGEAEFVGRIEDIVKMSKLTREDLKAILMDKNIGAFSKKREIYKASGMDLSIEEDTIEAIVDLIEKESAGARAVKNIMNQFADNQYFYDMKMGGYDILRIHKGMLHGENPIFLKGGAKNGEDIKNS